MDEYIEREAAIRKINGEFPDAHYPSWYAALIEEIPAADVVEVVRCEKCNRKIGEVNRIGCIYCGLHKGWFDKDAFCSYGKKRC